jgi:N-acetylglucosaminyl-diphospho-decaprenol L-rhamnosyltransferase
VFDDEEQVRMIACAVTYGRMPDLSIVIPTFNTASMTLRCCRAVLASMPQGTEVIVMDDGSTDGTAALLAREVPSVLVVRLDSNRGFAPAANRGAGAAHGRIIMLLNSDAIVGEGALHAIVAAFDADPNLGIAGAQLINEDGTRQWSGGPTPTLPWMIGVVSGAGRFVRLFRRNAHRQECLCEVDWVSGAAMAVRAEVWQAAGPLDEQFRFYCQDIELCLRARNAGWRVAVVENAPVIHTLGGTVAGHNALRHDPERLWPDLFDWGTAHYGKRWSVVARIVLVSAAWLRITWSSVFRRGQISALIRGARSLQRSDS